MPALVRVFVTRTAQAIGTAWAVATLCFVLLHAIPGDLALRVATARLGEDRVTSESADRIRHETGLDRPLTRQYADWIGHLALGDFGRSLVSGKPVGAELAYHATYTIALGATGWLLSWALALPIGVAAGFRPDGALDRAVMVVSAALSSVPSFLLGLGLVSAFALTLRWLPAAGSGGASHMVLPALTLALGLAAFSARVVRNAVMGTRAAFFMTFVRIKGLAAGRAFLVHGLRNAAVPVATFAAVQFIYVMDGFVVIETLFAYPGLGSFLVKSLLARDVPVITGAGLVIGIAFALINLAADLACLALDPRSRAAALL
jgi:peptide/nickel transport system permease protein